MISKILAWLTDGKASTWLTVIIGTAAGVVIFFCGYGIAANSYEAEIAQLHAEYQATATAVAKANMKEAENNAQKLAEAISARDEALARAGTLDADVARLREQASGYERRLSAADAGACKPCKAELARCVGLLSEGASLAGEGANLSSRIAADKDAVTSLLSVDR